MKYIYAILAGILSGVFAAYATAIIIGVTNIYLMGHNITWPSEEFNWYFIHISFLDFILVGISILVMTAVYIITLKFQ
jgi:TRAP-type C4-dicarboxylate transport system permease small subunit